MARQKGPLKVKGTLGDLTFYKGKEGYLLREKGGVDGNRIATDPKFQRTRENGAEFGRAGVSGKLLRAALGGVILTSRDGRMVSRLTRMMVKVLQEDVTNPRGLRNVIDGEAELLKGFEFNIDSKIESTLYAPFSTTIDRVTGELTLNIPSFVPQNMLSAPSGATHYRIISGGAAVNFEANSYEVVSAETAELPINGLGSAVVTHTHGLTPASTSPLFIVVAIQFFQQVNGTMYPLKNGSFNPAAIVDVSGY